MLPRIKLAGDWKVSVSAKNSAGKEIMATVKIAAPIAVKVQDEKHDKLPDFNPEAWGGWQKGVPLNGVLAQECTTRFALDPATLRVTSDSVVDAVVYEKNKDYEAELEWGSVGRLPEGRIKADQPVFISYEYFPQRIDTIILTSSNKITVKQGKPHIANPKPPALAPGEIRLSNIYIPCKTMKLEERIFIRFLKPNIRNRKNNPLRSPNNSSLKPWENSMETGNSRFWPGVTVSLTVLFFQTKIPKGGRSSLSPGSENAFLKPKSNW